MPAEEDPSSPAEDAEGAMRDQAVPRLPVALSPATGGHGATGAGQQRLPVAPSPATGRHGATGAEQQRPPPPPRPEQAPGLRPLTFRLVTEVNQINSFLIPYVMASLGPSMHDAGQAHAQVKEIFQTVVEALNLGNCRGRWSELEQMYQTEIDARMRYIKKNFQTVEQVP